MNATVDPNPPDLESEICTPIRIPILLLGVSVDDR